LAHDAETSKAATGGQQLSTPNRTKKLVKVIA
jgi:hypothetical protein